MSVNARASPRSRLAPRLIPVFLPPVTHAPILAPSLLAGDHAHLASSAALVEQLGLSWLHVDIMDGHFVPNLAFGPETVASLRRHGCKLFLDTHLMLSEPQHYVEAFARAGSDQISIHIEPAYDHAAALARIRALGSKAGLVLNPDTPASAVEPFLDQVDLILVMTVQPGFGGQPFRTDMLAKLTQLATWRSERNLSFRLEVDGGIDLSNAPLCRAADADTFVAGTSFFKADDKPAFVQAFARL
ncbi:MAG: ribulose-phosphate 3-epimerase [Undibacterium sp.]|nr:ribulose-phosphate 3-epimerase [Opitutaceae bacterium]